MLYEVITGGSIVVTLDDGLALLPLPVRTSARRYRAGGPLRTMGRNWIALLGWRLGIDRERLAEWLRR